jgi:hypothetical protein
MRIRPRVNDLLWMGAGAAVLLLFIALVLLFGEPPGPDARLAARVRRLDLVARMQLGLASASEAEKSAVLAITDSASQSFADQARSSTAEVEHERRELAEQLSQGGTQEERDLLDGFSRRFAEFQKIDDELLGLAVRNSNLKAYALAFGAGADAVDEMRTALSGVVAANADSRDAKEVTALALGAEIGALRIQTLLPPHIAESSDARMDELEAQMAQEDEQVRGDLQRLAAIPKLRGDGDLATAAARYAKFVEIRSQILALSRENTNVRSLSISLNEKRQVMLDCHEALSQLEDAIRMEPTAGSAYGERFRVR